MSKLGISTGTIPNDGTGDSLLDGAIKVNSNFDEIYSTIGDGSNLTVSSTNVDALITLSGVPAGSVGLGSFSRGIISDDAEIKTALQELEISTSDAAWASRSNNYSWSNNNDNSITATYVTTDTADWANATKIYVHRKAKNDVDMQNVFNNILLRGARVYIQKTNDATKSFVANIDSSFPIVTGSGTDQVFEYSVINVSTIGGVFDENVAVNFGVYSDTNTYRVVTAIGIATAGLASTEYVNQQIAAPITQSLIPDTDNAYDLGSPTKQWREIYVTSDTMYVGGIPVGVSDDGRLTVNREPLAKLSELNEDRIEVLESDVSSLKSSSSSSSSSSTTELETEIETLKTKITNFDSLVGIASVRIEELQDAMITMQAVYNGQIQTLTQKITALPKTVHASWDSSAAGSFDWSTDKISSSGVTNVTRQDKGIYRITFSEDFSSTNYTITTGVGSNDYSGTNSSPRGVSVLLESRTVSSVDVICERTDDSVNEDNAYMSIIIMGT